MKDVTIDLHLHLDGSVSLCSAKALAKEQGMILPDDAELLRLLTVGDGCGSLAEYLEKFDFPLSLLQTEAAIEQATYTLCRELADEGCIYAEIRFAPQLHTRAGLTQRDAVAAAVRGLDRSALDGGIILCCMRGDRNQRENIETVELAEELLDRGVVALDLAGNEAGYPNSSFEDIFKTARDRNIPFTIHAGEADGAESVRKAIEMGASRIGHGVRSLESPELIATLAQCGIALELCPTSNVNTAIFDSIGEYPIRELIAAGVTVTVNSDNRSVSHTTARQDMHRLRDAGLIDSDTERHLLINSANAAFCTEEVRQRLIEKIEAAYADK